MVLILNCRSHKAQEIIFFLVDWYSTALVFWSVMLLKKQGLVFC